ncbi:MAG TPA: helix-turn-helix domain-containing protein [Trebonia sp.]|nr:helix-turn-helix domain-containing protein [Trebonia sp.]
MEKYADVLLARWSAVPSGQGAGTAWLLPALDSLADDITAAITGEVEEYAQSGDDPAARAVRRVAQDAVAGFADRVAQGRGTASAAAMFHDLGRLLAAEGRSLEALHAALRVGARVTWQRLQEQARQGNGNAEAFARIGETVFWYMDELAASCSAGYAEAKAELAGETSQLRRRLLDMLTSSPPPPAAVIASLAQAAGWPLPGRVAAVALARPAGSNPAPLPPGVLAGLSRRDPCLLIPDPDGPGRRRQLAAALRGWLAAVPATAALPATAQPGTALPAAALPPATRPATVLLAAVGPAVPLAGASGSLRWASQGLALARRGLLDNGDGVVWCEDHLPTLILLADADLAAALSREALAPLRQLRPEQADRLAQTLLAWLESADDANAAARRLHVHPQTIRYRLRQVGDLFGDALAAPDSRFRLLLALHARQLLKSPAGTRSARP